jgi:very-short-patch-repair endonuclease
MSEKRKKYLAENKDKHNWSRYSNKESEPEKRFRELAEKTNLNLVQWHIPPESNRLYEMDFADPINKIDFEINGNQHYTQDGYLNQHYQERHDYFVSLGWKVIEIHYSIAFVESQLIEILNLCYNDFSKAENKIQELSDGRKERKRLIEEKKKQESLQYEVSWSKHKFTQKQINFQLKRRKVQRPSKKELSEMVWKKPSTQISKYYGVSDKAIEKWCKAYGISKPPRGYWAKLINM